MTGAALRTSILRYQFLGLALVLILVGGLGAWAAVASIASAVIAPATVVVESYPKKVQHREGGIVAEIPVSNGDRIAAGETLLRLDETEARASLQIVESQLREYTARRARLLAERDGRSELQPPSDPDAIADPEAARIWQAQARLLTARRETRAGKKQQLRERIGQLEQSIIGLKAQERSKERQAELIRQELSVLYQLEGDKLVTKNRLLALEREAVRLEGERAQLIADIARTHVQIGETRLQLLEIDQSFLTEVLAELREAEARIAELTERLVAAKARSQRLEVVAPSSGIVHKLAIHTIGGVIAPGEVIAEIVPEEDLLVLESRVDPAVIDRVKMHQPAVVRLPSADGETTPELSGSVTMVSPDAKQDAPTQLPHFVVRVALTERERDKVRRLALQPGMPAEVYIQTGSRTPLSYLLKPLSDQFRRAMREE
jgi:HlyD family secretion protein